MVTNTVNFDIHTKIRFFTEALNAYKEHFIKGIDQGCIRLIIPLSIAFETGEQGWIYTDAGNWEMADDIPWEVLECEVFDAKTV